MSEEALERLLALSGGEGEVESSAEFTLSPEKALEKLSAYQLPDPGLWPDRNGNACGLKDGARCGGPRG